MPVRGREHPGAHRAGRVVPRVPRAVELPLPLVADGEVSAEGLRVEGGGGGRGREGRGSQQKQEDGHRLPLYLVPLFNWYLLILSASDKVNGQSLLLFLPPI